MELQTERLYIRSLRESDWPALQKIWMDFEGSAYAVYDAPLPTDAKGAEALTQKFADSGLFFAVCLPDRPAGPVMGYVGFHKEGQSCDLGYCFHSADDRLFCGEPVDQRGNAQTDRKNGRDQTDHQPHRIGKPGIIRNARHRLRHQ